MSEYFCINLLQELLFERIFMLKIVLILMTLQYTQERMSKYICTNKFGANECPNIFPKEKLIRMNIQIDMCEICCSELQKGIWSVNGMVKDHISHFSPTYS